MGYLDKGQSRLGGDYIEAEAEQVMGIASRFASVRSKGKGRREEGACLRHAFLSKEEKRRGRDTCRGGTDAEVKTTCEKRKRPN